MKSYDALWASVKNKISQNSKKWFHFSSYGDMKLQIEYKLNKD